MTLCHEKISVVMKHLTQQNAKILFSAMHTTDEGCAKLEEARFGGGFFSFLFRIIPFADF